MCSIFIKSEGRIPFSRTLCQCPHAWDLRTHFGRFLMNFWQNPLIYQNTQCILYNCFWVFPDALGHLGHHYNCLRTKSEWNNWWFRWISTGRILMWSTLPPEVPRHQHLGDVLLRRWEGTNLVLRRQPDVGEICRVPVEVDVAPAQHRPDVEVPVVEQCFLLRDFVTCTVN